MGHDLKDLKVSELPVMVDKLSRQSIRLFNHWTKLYFLLDFVFVIQKFCTPVCTM